MNNACQPTRNCTGKRARFSLDNGERETETLVLHEPSCRFVVQMDPRTVTHFPWKSDRLGIKLSRSWQHIAGRVLLLKKPWPDKADCSFNSITDQMSGLEYWSTHAIYECSLTSATASHRTDTESRIVISAAVTHRRRA